MANRHFNKAFIIAIVTTFFTTGCDKGQDDEKPNIVFILADDMGWGDPQCYNANSLVETPIIDDLASEGMRFTDAHTPAATCTQTRYGLLTGRAMYRQVWEREPLGAHASQIADGRLTLGDMLRSKGYKTACVGKWHLGFEYSTPDSFDTIKGGPVERGFDYYYGIIASANRPPFTFVENNRLLGDVEYRKRTYPGYHKTSHKGPMSASWDIQKILSTVVDKSVEYLEKADGSEPFFLYVPLPAPHTPIAPSDPFIGSTAAGPYGDFVHEVDYSVGRILKVLDERGMRDNTIVIFSSDNGSPCHAGNGNGTGFDNITEETGHDPSGHFRGIKGTAWEGGHRVPFIVRWPGKIQRGYVNDNMICLTDMMATFAAIVDFPLPDNAGEDSYDILSEWLRPEVGKSVRKVMLNHCEERLSTVRKGDWKLIFGLGSGWPLYPFREETDNPAVQGQLYNLREDPSEKLNLWLKHPEKVKELTDLMETMRREKRSAPHGIN